MNLILIFSLLLSVFAEPNQFAWSVSVDDYCVMFTEHKAPVTWYKDGQWTVANADIQLLTHEDFFKILCRRWTRPFTLRTFATLARHWPKQEKLIEPPMALPTVWLSMTGTKYHLQTCRYVTDTYIETDIMSALQTGFTACSVCKPIFTE